LEPLCTILMSVFHWRWTSLSAGVSLWWFITCLWPQTYPPTIGPFLATWMFILRSPHLRKNILAHPNTAPLNEEGLMLCSLHDAGKMTRWLERLMRDGMDNKQGEADDEHGHMDLLWYSKFLITWTTKSNWQPSFDDLKLRLMDNQTVDGPRGGGYALKGIKWKDKSISTSNRSSPNSASSPSNYLRDRSYSSSSPLSSWSNSSPTNDPDEQDKKPKKYQFAEKIFTWLTPQWRRAVVDWTGKLADWIDIANEAHERLKRIFPDYTGDWSWEQFKPEIVCIIVFSYLWWYFPGLLQYNAVIWLWLGLLIVGFHCPPVRRLRRRIRADFHYAEFQMDRANGGIANWNFYTRI